MPCGTSLSVVSLAGHHPPAATPPGPSRRQGKRAVRRRSASGPGEGPSTRLGKSRTCIVENPTARRGPRGPSLTVMGTTPDLPRKALQVLLEISGCVHPACASLGPAARCIAGYVPGTMLPPRTSGETFILPRQKLQPCRGFLEQQVAGMPIQDVQKPWFMYAGHR